MSQAPYLLPATARAPGLRLGSATLRDSMVSDGLTDAYKHVHMGVVAEATATEYQISRKEQVLPHCLSDSLLIFF
jgi:acetyl-CoA C-acetyltransferase